MQRLLKNMAYLATIGVVLYLFWANNLLLFNTTVETFSMVVASLVLVITWNGRKLLDSDYLLLVGISYMSFAIIDLPLMLSFQGIEAFPGFGPELTVQLYVVQRLILAGSFLIAPRFLTHRLHPYVTLGAYLAITAAALGYAWFAAGTPGLQFGGFESSAARRVLGAAVVVMLALATLAVWVNRRHLDREIMWLLIGVTGSLAVSELFMTISGPADDPWRVLGLYMEGLALFLTYKAVVEMAFRRPQALLYRELADRELAERTTSKQYQQVADTLQTALMRLPERLEGVSIVSRYRSSSDVARIGGDFYDVFEVDNRRVGFVLGDVSGKGLEAATITAEVKSTIRAYAYLRADPTFVLGRTNDALYRTLDESQFVTALFGVLDTVSGDLKLASAGHEEPVVCVKDRCGFLDVPANLPLGVSFGLTYRDASTRLFLGDGVLVYTDGVPDAQRGEERFGRDRLRQIVDRSRTSDPGQLADDVLAAVLTFAGGSLADDVAVLGLRLTRPDPDAAARAEVADRNGELVGTGLAGSDRAR